MTKPTKKTKTKTAAVSRNISLRLTGTQIQRLAALVVKKGANRSTHIQIAISEYLDKAGV